MTIALVTVALAALEAELAYRGQGLGDAERTRRHGGWALILFVFACATFWLGAFR